ncbi:unnamed protein product [Urochloa decumbens]|uniref:Uncharacterized protein n=1 Tax=Urochloa decumbens TaxID=240449 RepID=A0ABC9CQQ4_9POAL
MHLAGGTTKNNRRGWSTVGAAPSTAPTRPTPTCRRSAAAFRSPDDFAFLSDARIAVPGAPEIRVHRCVLCARSPFLRNLFARRAAAAEEKDKDKDKVELRELLGEEVKVGYEALQLVVDYLYSGRVVALPKAACLCVDEGGCAHVGCRPAVSFMAQVLFAASTFEVAELTSLFQRRLLHVLDKVEVDNLPLILSVANLCNKSCMKLLERCLEIEGKTNLDDAYALHYAVEHCDSKITTELLDLALADINHRNPRGYTVLHIAAMRMEPKIIVSLLTKGARPSDLTFDHRKALQICKRLTKHGDYFGPTEDGKPSPKDRLCIEILEQAERRDPQLGEASVSLATEGESLRGRLLYLENRVALARILFPMEARVAMDIAQVDGTLEFNLGSSANLTTGLQRTAVDLNDTPFIMKEEYLTQMGALSKTVELGKRFFPRCSKFLDKIMDDEIELASLGRDTSTDKKRRFHDLQDVLQKAFSEDKEENDRSARSSSSSSTTTSLGAIRPRR